MSTTPFFKQTFKILEPCAIIFVLLVAESIAVSPLTRTICNFASYGIVLFLLVELLKQPKHLAYLLSIDKSLLVLVAIAIASIAWSVAPQVTISQLGAMLRSTILGIYIAKRYSSKEQMYLFAWLVLVVIVLSIGFIIFKPSAAILEENGKVFWQGIYGSKQYLSRIMSLGVITYLLLTITIKKYRWVTLSIAGIAFTLLLLSQGKTGLSLCLVTLYLIGTYKFAEKHKYKLRIIVVCFTFLLSFTLLALILLNLETLIVDSLGKDLEFNGRTPIWESLIGKALERPFLGYGYSAFWNSEYGYNSIMNSWLGEFMLKKQTTAHAHNGFLDLILQLGCVGMLAYLINIIRMIIRLYSLSLKTKKIELVWMLHFVLFDIFFQFTEVISILSPNSYLWIFYVAIAIRSSLENNRYNQMLYSETVKPTKVLKNS